MFDTGTPSKEAIKAGQQNILAISRAAKTDEEQAMLAEYEQFCSENGITPPPKLLFSHDISGKQANANAISSDNTIAVSSTIPKLGWSKAALRGLLAHETAHILLANDLDATNKEVEYDTDRLAVVLLGEKEPLLKALRAQKEHTDKVNSDFLDTIEDAEGRENMRRVIEDSAKQGEERYGTHEERLAAISGYDEKNAAYAQEKITAYNTRQTSQRR